MNSTEDKVAIKELVDTFSIQADQKDVERQVLLFTENALVETYINGKLSSTLTGRKQIGEAFAAFLGRFHTVYHLNGQLVVTLSGDQATGIHYCQVTLIGAEDGKEMKTSFGVHYNDEYIRENGQWLIARRRSTFAWQEKRALNE